MPDGISSHVVLTVCELPPAISSKLLVFITEPSFLNCKSTLALPSPSFVISTEIVTVLPSTKSPLTDNESKDKSASVVIISKSEKVSLPGLSEFAIMLTSAVSPSVFSICVFNAFISSSETMSILTSYSISSSLNPTVPLEPLPTVKIISVISTPYSSMNVSPLTSFSSSISLSESVKDFDAPGESKVSLHTCGEFSRFNSPVHSQFFEPVIFTYGSSG